MSFSPVLAAVLAGFLSLPAAAEPVRLVPFASYSSNRTYGLYVVAPSDCAFVRYRLSGPGLHPQSHVLRAGQARVFRLGKGFAPGLHLVQLDSPGCTFGPAEARQVVLHKASPDHGAAALHPARATGRVWGPGGGMAQPPAP